MRFVLLLIAAVIAIVAGVAALQISSKPPAPAPGQAQVGGAQAPVNTVEVMVAKQPIPVGTVIDESMVDKQPWPEHLVLDGFVVDNGQGADLVGKVARSSFQAREPFLSSKLANPNDPSFLAAELAPGMRAMTIATDAVSGVAGYIFPGDRVDILFTHNVPQQVKADQPSAVAQAASNRGDKPAVTEVLAPNTRILAVNLRSVGKEVSQNAAPSSMTVEVSEAQAQALRLAEKTGTLSLVLRSLKDKDNRQEADPTVLANLSRVHLVDTQADQVKVVRGAGKENDENASGGVRYSTAGKDSDTIPSNPAMVMDVLQPDNALPPEVASQPQTPGQPGNTVQQ